MKEEPKLIITPKTIHGYLYHRPTMGKTPVYVVNHRTSLYDVEKLAKRTDANTRVVREYRRKWNGKKKLQAIRILHSDGKKSEYKLYKI